MKRFLLGLFAAALCAHLSAQPIITIATNKQAADGTATGCAINPYQLKTYGPSGTGTAIHGTPSAGQMATWYDATHVQGASLTTVGAALAGLTNPSAITFVRINANNSVDALSASNFRTAIGAGAGSGDALTSGKLSQFAATSSAEFLGVISDETGTGLVVANNNPTLIGLTLTGIVNTGQTPVTASGGPPQTATIDVTKPETAVTISNTATLTLSAAGSAGDNFRLRIINSAATTYVATVKTSAAATIEAVTVPASTTVEHLYENVGGTYLNPFGADDLDANRAAPASTDIIPTTNPTTGARSGSTVAQTVQAVLPAPGAIGGTTPAAGTFTTVTTTGDIELGNASDTTIHRSAGGAVQIEGVAVATASNTVTLTNKRITLRVGSTTSSATPTINTDSYDIYVLTAQAADITSMTSGLSGSPADGDTLEIRITGTAARAITWGTSWAAGPVALPTTTVTTKTLRCYFEYDGVVTKWVCLAAGSDS